MRDNSDCGVRPEAILAVLLIISILMIIFSPSFRLREGRQEGGEVVFALQRVIGSISRGTKDAFGSIRNYREVRSRYESALEQIASYQGLERDLLELRRENEALRSQLNFSTDLEYNHLAARVIAGDPSNIFDAIIIDKGKLDGVEPGMVVTAFQDGFFGLVGKVVFSGGRSSQVRPLIDPDHFVAGRLQEWRYEGLVEGRGDGEGSLIMRYVRKAAGPQVALNDLVVTSGMRSIYPPGIFIGRVSEIRSREYATSLELFLEPVVDVGRLEYVFVMKEGGS